MIDRRRTSTARDTPSPRTLLSFKFFLPTDGAFAASPLSVCCPSLSGDLVSDLLPYRAALCTNQMMDGEKQTLRAHSPTNVCLHSISGKVDHFFRGSPSGLSSLTVCATRAVRAHIGLFQTDLRSSLGALALPTSQAYISRSRVQHARLADP